MNTHEEDKTRQDNTLHCNDAADPYTVGCVVKKE